MRRWGGAERPRRALYTALCVLLAPVILLGLALAGFGAILYIGTRLGLAKVFSRI